MLVKFVKYEGAGNDFILIDDREGAFRPDAGHIAALCDRHFGIGADGLMTLRRSAGLDCSMRYYNADGSAGEMCGNGARCFALFAEHLGIGGETKYFDATDGVHTAHIRRAQGPAGEIELGMINVSEIRSGDGWWFLNTGVPHYVEMVHDVDGIDVNDAGLRHGCHGCGDHNQLCFAARNDKIPDTGSRRRADRGLHARGRDTELYEYQAHGPCPQGFQRGIRNRQFLNHSSFPIHENTKGNSRT